MKVGFIGLGVMGGNMAMNLVKAGFEVAVSDMVPEAVKRLTDAGAAAKGNAKEVAEFSEIVCSSLPNSAILRNVALGADGVLAGLSEGALHVDFSSVEPALARDLAAKYAVKKAAFIDAPVSGGIGGAQAGTLTIMVGGGPDSIERARPVLEAVGKKISHVGDVGSGQAMKAVNNLLLGANMVAVAEALVLGKKLGLEPQVMYDIIGQSSGRSYALETKGKNFIMARKFDPGFAVDLQYKDLELAISTAKSLNVPLPMGALAQQFFEAARAKGWGREDISSVIKFFEELAKVEVRG